MSAIGTQPALGRRRAALLTQARATPTPSEITDSPSATITIRPYPSAKWAGEIRQPGPTPSKPPPYITRSARTHSGTRHPPSTQPASRISDGPTIVEGTSRASAGRTSGRPFLAKA